MLKINIKNYTCDVNFFFIRNINLGRGSSVMCLKDNNIQNLGTSQLCKNRLYDLS